MHRKVLRIILSCFRERTSGVRRCKYFLRGRHKCLGTKAGQESVSHLQTKDRVNPDEMQDALCPTKRPDENRMSANVSTLIQVGPSGRGQPFVDIAISCGTRRFYTTAKRLI